MSNRIKSRLGYEYDLKEAMRSNPTIITAGDDIMAVALARIEALEAENTRLRSYLSDIEQGRGMLGVNTGTDLIWAMEHARAALTMSDEQKIVLRDVPEVASLDDISATGIYKVQDARPLSSLKGAIWCFEKTDYPQWIVSFTEGRDET